MTIYGYERPREPYELTPHEIRQLQIEAEDLRRALTAANADLTALLKVSGMPSISDAHRLADAMTEADKWRKQAYVEAGKADAHRLAAERLEAEIRQLRRFAGSTRPRWGARLPGLIDESN